MRKRLEEIAFYAGERMYRDLDEIQIPLSPKNIRERLLPLSDLDFVKLNMFVNKTVYNGRGMVRVDNWLGIGAGIVLGMKYIIGYGVLGSISYVSLKNLIN